MTMSGLTTLLAIPLPVALLILPDTTVIGENTSVSIFLLLVLTGAVFKAGKEVQKLRQKFELLEKMEKRMDRVEQELSLPPLTEVN